MEPVNKSDYIDPVYADWVWEAAYQDWLKRDADKPEAPEAARLVAEASLPFVPAGVSIDPVYADWFGRDTEKIEAREEKDRPR